MNNERTSDYAIIRQAGKRIDAIRITHGDTQRSLASVVGISYCYMSRLLRDKDEWARRHVEKVAEHYHVSFDYLYYGITSSEMKEENNLEQDFETQTNDLLIRLRNMSGRDKNKYLINMLVTLIDIIVECTVI